MNGKVERLAMVLLPILVVAACPGFGDEEPAGLFEEVPDIVTYEDHISRLYEVRCNECHSSPAKLGAPGNFRLDDFKGAVDQIGLSNIRVANPSNPMPPSSRPQLSDIERQVMLRWVECGTPERASQADCPDPNAAPEPDNTPPARLTYGDAIKPIFDKSCNFVGCHAGDTSISSGLNLETFQGLQEGLNPDSFVPCDSERSTLAVRLKLDQTSPLFMPLGGQPLSEGDIETVVKWIEEGEDVTPLCEDEEPVGLCGNYIECLGACDEPTSVACMMDCAGQNGGAKNDCLLCIGEGLDTCSEQFCKDEYDEFIICFQDCRFAQDVLQCLQEDCPEAQVNFDACMVPVIRNRNCNADLDACDFRIPVRPDEFQQDQ